MGKLVCIIDDSPTIRHIVEVSLQREGYEVQCFNDGMEAMKKLHEPHVHPPHLILLDIVLPKMDGYSVAQRIQAKPLFSKTVVVMLSRRDGVVDRLMGRLAGAKASLTKPFTIEDLLTVVQASIGLPEAGQEESHLGK